MLVELSSRSALGRAGPATPATNALRINLVNTDIVDNDPKTRSSIKYVYRNFKNHSWLLFICHNIIYFLHNSAFQVPAAMCILVCTTGKAKHLNLLTVVNGSHRRKTASLSYILNYWHLLFNFCR